MQLSATQISPVGIVDENVAESKHGGIFFIYKQVLSLHCPLILNI